MIKRYTIRKRIWITIWFTSVFSAILFLLLTFYLYDRFYLQTQEDILLNRGEKLINIYESEGLSGAFYDGMTYTNELTESKVFFIDFLQENPGGLRFLTNEDIEQLRNGQTVVSSRTHPIEGSDILMTGFPIIENNRLVGTLILYLELGQISEPFRPLRLMIFFMIGLIVLNLVIFGRQIIDTIIRPLIDMKRASTVYAQGDFDYRIPIQSDDEIGELAETLNKMAESLGEVDEQRKEFLANVSHELRTPLSYIRGYTEMMQDEHLDTKTRDQYYQIIERETERLQRLVNDLLDLAQLERDSYPMTKQPLVFSQVLEDVVYRMAPIAQAKGIQLVTDFDPSQIVLGDNDRLEQVIGNLIDNALRYTPSDRSIYLTTKTDGDLTICTIRDEGEGIPTEHLERLTKRFYRVDKSRTRKDGGTGLGLAITKHIIDRHDGTLAFTSEIGQGTTVTITLPLLPDEDDGFA
ncbi:sensor histidine kinase [Exiguobacterium oxidotolerans]|uniref:histidine kinase n=1 Tax=Exiguobacterium oxidotolerans TaxID=223958 RepID=A0A653IFZ8_9BACL|nr:HAMP domain-containing sensor histidine kinase [Exiguobacterium oxidotolerans]VWX38147.1 Two-component sensor histidine kinase [Exiguobacterium oxidotolerans]